jgi:putative hydrolase of the HAD superfamily
MLNPHADILRKHSRPLAPIATGETPALRRLDGIRAVLFDLYGTLFISDSGEVGTARKQAEAPLPAPQQALADALVAMGIPASESVGQGIECFFRSIEASHAESRQTGIDYPEVDLVEIWRSVLAELARQGLVEQPACTAIDLKRLAVEYEARANPCWPMPHLQECLGGLRRGGLVLGIISNAQFYTPDLFPALLGGPAESWGFDPQLQFYSYQHGRAKPGTALYKRAAEVLCRRGISPGEAIYVGNDMLNDILPACKLGFRTALFAGDARSLRRREQEQTLAGISPDLVLTELTQLVECMMDSRSS